MLWLFYCPLEASLSSEIVSETNITLEDNFAFAQAYLSLIHWSIRTMITLVSKVLRHLVYQFNLLNIYIYSL